MTVGDGGATANTAGLGMSSAACRVGPSSRRPAHFFGNVGAKSWQLKMKDPMRRTVVTDSSGTTRRLSLLCGDCVSDHWRVQRATPCETCGRPVVQGWHATRTHTFCCERCARHAGNLRQAERTAVDLHRICPCCGGAFEARRRDTRWCSSFCRERAYRQRRRTSL
jgi:hypothetical protein